MDHANANRRRSTRAAGWISRWLPVLPVLLGWLGFALFAADSPPAKAARFRVLVLAEPGGQHAPFVKAARAWLEERGREDGFALDYLTGTETIDAALLAKYRLFLQLDYPPYRWTSTAKAAFESYIDEGKGGWVGLHHATLLGEFDGYPMWPWFHDFMGGIRFRNYIPTFAAATVRVEATNHPCFKGLPPAFTIAREEWYTYDRSPRPQVHVLASVDESTYSPDSKTKMGDHPVIWTNDKKAARNVYIFMGHGPDLLDNPAYRTLLRNALLWAAGDAAPD